MHLSLNHQLLAICQLAPDAPLPAWATRPAAFCSITRTSEELSIVCPANAVPVGVKQQANWRMLKVKGPLDFGLTGVLASIASPLAQAGISIFPLATFNTDYVLVQDSMAALAVQALEAAGHTVGCD